MGGVVYFSNQRDCDDFNGICELIRKRDWEGLEKYLEENDLNPYVREQINKQFNCDILIKA